MLTPLQTVNILFRLDPTKALESRRVLREIADYHLEKRYVHKGGRAVWALLSVSLVRDAAEIARRRDQVLARFPRLRERLNQLAGSMSGGEQQMLALGRALMGAPKLLLLDEPSMGLAPLFVEEIFLILTDLRREGTTILLVEQNASAALDISDHAYVLETGRITLQGPASEIANDPAVIAAYLGG